jgi:hypothetical protein
MSLLQASKTMQRKKNKRKRKQQALIDVEKESKKPKMKQISFHDNYQFMVGIDPSVSSPSICIWNPYTRQVTIHGWSSKQPFILHGEIPH